MSKAEIISRRGPHKVTPEEDKAFEQELTQEAANKAKLKDMMKKKAEKKAPKAVEKEEKMEMVEVVEKQDRALEWFVVGCGQGGSRVAEAFYNNGYDAVALNTAEQDLKYIKLPENNKLLIRYALDGAAKDLVLGEEAFTSNAPDIDKWVRGKLPDPTHMIILAVTGGGGTGSGGAYTMIDILRQYGFPVSVLYIMPLESDDITSKNNSLITLSKLAKLAKQDVINSLIVVDNAKIETLPYLKQGNFWAEANKLIVDPLHKFNALSVCPSNYTSLDPMDTGKLLTTGDCTIYGHLSVSDYMEELSLAEAIIDSLESGLLASGFDIKTARAVGVIVLGDKEVLDEIPAVNINYAFDTLNELTNNATIFKGIYEADTEGAIKIYTLFSGLGLPRERIEKLKEEAAKGMEAQQKKDDNRATTMEMDYNTDNVKNDVKKIHEKIKRQRSAFGKLTQNAKGGGIIDRRKR